MLQFELGQNIPQHEFTIVSEHYSHSKYLEPQRFRKLLFQLGVTDCIQAPKQTLTLSPASKAASPWADTDLGSAPEGGWRLHDFSLSEFEAIVESVVAAEEKDTPGLHSMQYLAEMMSAHWAAYLSHCCTATCTNSAGKLCISAHYHDVCVC